MPSRFNQIGTVTQQATCGCEITREIYRRELVAKRERHDLIAAVFKRNFFGYLSNPAGYVFITLFVFVCSWVAFGYWATRQGVPYAGTRLVRAATPRRVLRARYSEGATGREVMSASG